jgi:hypothetical protein
VRRLAGFLSAALLIAAWPLNAADYHVGPEDYRDHLTRLQAGDRLLLRAGVYTRGLPLRDLHGEAERPIVIEGPSDGARARFVARRGAHTVSLIDVSHVTLRNLQLDGARLPVDAVRAEGHARYAHFVTLENLHIHDHDASQQNVGISTKAPAFGWVVRGNLIERVGTGMYFGDSDGSDPFVAGLIEDNHIRATLGYNLQIKHQAPRPAGLPGAGQAQTPVIRRNVFDKRDGGPPGPMARPNLLVGHWPLSGDGSDDRYLIHANLFWHNPGEALFQGEGRFALYNNLFITDGPDAIRVQPHNDVPRDVRVLFNTVLAAGNGITVLHPEANPYTQLVAGNLVFAARPLHGGTREANLTGTRAAAARHLADPGAMADTREHVARALAPRDGRAPTRRLDPAWLVDLPDIGFDFAGRPRPPGAIGALVSPRRRRRVPRP